MNINHNNKENNVIIEKENEYSNKLTLEEEPFSFSLSISKLTNSITNLKDELKNIQSNIKLLEKQTNKHIKGLERELNKKLPKNKKKPSGFAKPTDISIELCNFLDLPFGTQMARTEVTQHLIKYIKNNNLQNEDNKRIIKPDNKLTLLLDIENNNELTYFNLQSYMNRHFCVK